MARAVVLGIVVAGIGLSAQPEPVAVVRIGLYVERYYTRVQSIVADEDVVVQPLTRDLQFAGFPRRLRYELRMEWNPEAPDETDAASVVRTLVSATGPRLGPPDKPDCLDPGVVSPEILAFLLPAQRHKNRFTMAGTGRVGDAVAVKIDYRPVAPGPVHVEWEKDCGQIDAPGRTRGRIWADPVSFEVLRVDESLTGQIELPPPPKSRLDPMSFNLERSDSTTVYERVTFRNPDETLLMPARVESVVVIRNSGVPQRRVTHRLTNYRRFVTASRIIQ